MHLKKKKGFVAEKTYSKYHKVELKPKQLDLKKKPQLLEARHFHVCGYKSKIT